MTSGDVKRGVVTSLHSDVQKNGAYVAVCLKIAHLRIY